MADAKRELEQFFPFQQTLALIKPGLSATQKGQWMELTHLISEELFIVVSV